MCDPNTHRQTPAVDYPSLHGSLNHGGADEPESASESEPEYDYAKAAAGDGSSVDCIRITALRGADLGALSDVLLSLGATCCSVEDADLGTDAEQELYAVGIESAGVYTPRTDAELARAHSLE